MPNRLRIVLFRPVLLSALLFFSGMVLLAYQPAALANTKTPLRPQATWSQQAEAKCNFYYINRGNPLSVKDDPSLPPWVASSSNNMAVYEMWHYALATRTVRALGYINGAPADGIRMINAMRTYASLSLEMANVYAEGGIQYNKITALGSQQESAAREVQSLSASLNTPSCYSVVNTQE